MMLGPGSTIEEYEIVRLTAIGGMCHVYEACADGESKTVAIKVLHTMWSADDETLRRFRNEAKLLRDLRHPHIVSLLGAGNLSDGAPYMILEWLPFHLALVLAERRHPIALDGTVHVATQVARALVALHNEGIIHRDIKAANVLLDRDDIAQAQIRLCDLGLAKVAPDQQVASLRRAHVSTGGGALLGTWDYMAPEQWIKSKTVDAKADVYSLGVLLFQMLAGCLPFVAEEAKALMTLHLFEDPPMPRLDENAPRALRCLIEQMLHKIPKSRPTMHEVLGQLEAMHNNQG